MDAKSEHELISYHQAGMLSAVRAMLFDLEGVAQRQCWDSTPQFAFGLGRFAEACQSAEHAIFQALNVAANYLDDRVARASIDSYNAGRGA